MSAVGVALLGDDRRPQPGVAAADDAQVAALGAHQRGVAVGLVDVVVPVGVRVGVGDGVEVEAGDARRRRVAAGARSADSTERAAGRRPRRSARRADLARRSGRSGRRSWRRRRPPRGGSTTSSVAKSGSSAIGAVHVERGVALLLGDAQLLDGGEQRGADVRGEATQRVRRGGEQHLVALVAVEQVGVLGDRVGVERLVVIGQRGDERRVEQHPRRVEAGHRQPGEGDACPTGASADGCAAPSGSRTRSWPPTMAQPTRPSITQCSPR